mmetsp:Transcript_24212/g.31426  ORF Transcript_24212/g.31426 Transcript_24212/m.31426 type:complete len:992 (-) Transcript_24212:399-3374(-)
MLNSFPTQQAHGKLDAELPSSSNPLLNAEEALAPQGSDDSSSRSLPPRAVKLGLPVALLEGLALPLSGGAGMGVGSVMGEFFDLDSPNAPKKRTEIDMASLTPPPQPMVLLNSAEEGAECETVKPIENATLSITNAVDIVESLFKPHRITFSLKIPLKRDGPGMGLGLRELPVRGALLVHTLKRSNEVPVGVAEMHGVCLGDVVLGIRYEPVGNGLSWLAEKIKSESESFVTFQVSRDLSIMPVLPPTKTNQSVSRLMHHASTLHRSQLITLADRFRLHELALRLLAFGDGALGSGLAPGERLMRRVPSWHKEDEGTGSEDNQAPESTVGDRSPSPEDMDVDSSYFSKLGPAPVNFEDPRSLVVWAKGLRPAVSVRVLYARPFKKTVLYILWIEDIASGKSWKLSKRFSEFRTLQAKLVSLVPTLAEVFFPRRRLAMKAVISHFEVVEKRIIHLEAFLRRALWISMGSILECPKFSEALKLLEVFLEVPAHVRPFHQNAPTASKLVELHAFKLLESPGGSQVGYLGQSLRTTFDTVALARSGRSFLEEQYMQGEEGLMSPAFRAPLEEMGARLKKLEQSIEQLHSRELWIECQRRKRETEELRSKESSSCSTTSPDAQMPHNVIESMRVLMHRAIRRQVEAFLFLPLRRSIYRCMYRHLSDAAARLEEIMQELRDHCPPDMFLVPEGIQECHHWESALRAFRRVAKLQLPCDQIAALSEASKYVVLLHRELFRNKESEGCDQTEEVAETSGVHQQLLMVETAEANAQCILQRVNTEKSMENDQFLVRTHSSLSFEEESEAEDEEEDDGGENELHLMGSRKGSTSSLLHKPKKEGHKLKSSKDTEGVELNGMYDDALLQYSTFSMEGLTPKCDGQDGKQNQGTFGEFPTEKAQLDLATTTQPQVPKTDDETPSRNQKVEVEQWLSADDFLPIFTFTLVYASPPHLLLLLEYLKQLMDPEESIKERGYYVATLEASVHLILEIHRQLRKSKFS